MCWTDRNKTEQVQWMDLVSSCPCPTAPPTGAQGYHSSTRRPLTTDVTRVCVYVCVSVFTSIYGREGRTQGSKARGANVVVVVTVGVRSVLLVICCPVGKGRWAFRGEERRRGGQRDVWRALCPFFVSDAVLVGVTPPLSAGLLFGFDEFGQRLGSGPLAPPDGTATALSFSNTPQGRRHNTRHTHD